MAADPGHCWIFVEGGGSQTWLACVTDTGIEALTTGPTSVRSVTAEESQAALALLARGACQAAEADPSRCRAVVAAHGAASTAGTCEAFFAILKAALRPAGIDCPLLLTNDLVPVVLGGGDGGPLVAVVAGTGTGFAARSAAGQWARASGCEYLLSDEGGGFDIGVSGLRAAVRAIDGRGAPTALVTAARQWSEAAGPDIVERLSAKVYVPDFKPVVASFAPYVLTAAAGDEARAGDEVAAGIVAASARELAAGVLAVIRSAGCRAASTRVVMSGSLLTRHEILARGLRDELCDHVSRENIDVIPDGWMLAGFSRLRDAWWSGDGTIELLARAFPVTADAR